MEQTEKRWNGTIKLSLAPGRDKNIFSERFTAKKERDETFDMFNTVSGMKWDGGTN